MMKKTNSFKLAMVAVGMLTIGTVSAQQTDATNADLAKQATAVKSVDNKGTIKHVQVANGLTEATDAATNVTTFQLGGVLVAPTTITASAGKALNIAGIAETSVAGGDLPATAFGDAGLSLMVRDEQTGEVKKLLASDAAMFLSAFSPAAYGTGNTTTVTVIGLPKIDPADAVDPLTNLAHNNSKSRLFVYKNGVKLVFGTDFTVNTAGQVDILVPVIAADDIIEVQYTN
ncbi:conserved exported hypothetical protein [Tenacibaculum finnmarkense]|nr:conserved exported hypothetical protein [Tenacibaculum finnmarkense]